MHRFAFPLLSCVLIFVASTAGAAKEPNAPIDVCSLLTSEEIQGVIGEAVKESKSADQAEGGFLISQCQKKGDRGAQEGTP